jgi:predicted HTH transcriptional regulator
MLLMQKVTSEQVKGLGESQSLEFKRSIQLKESFIDLCGMVNANVGYGTVVFGVEPNGEIIGLGAANLDSAQKTLALHAQQKLDPAIPIEIHAVDCGGMPLLVMTASRSRGVAYHEYDGRAFIRAGSITRQLSTAEKQQLYVSRNRDLHGGPWKCDRCGAVAGMISQVEITADGARKHFRHSCGGEWWPAA